MKNIILQALLLSVFLPCFLNSYEAWSDDVLPPVHAPEASSTQNSSEESIVDMETIKSGLYKGYEGAKDTIRAAKDSWDALGPEQEKAAALAKEELDKLFRIEYKIVDFEISVSRELMETELQSLGHDRWDCAPFPGSEKQIRFVCKRLPQSYLRLLLRARP